VTDQATLLADVELHGRNLSAAVKAAEDAGVSPALVLPALFSVFRDAGMIPESLDLGSIMGLVGG
jgi:hypothetical protein